jgi:hypothetical protein
MPPGANLPRWEHLCMGGSVGADYSGFINRAGDEGWELVGISERVLCFKRPRALAPTTSVPTIASPTK